jgi:hypothetical protein
MNEDLPKEMYALFPSRLGPEKFNRLPSCIKAKLKEEETKYIDELVNQAM